MENGIVRNSNDELYHYGVLGMKWGHRKSNYDNSDGAYNRHGRKATTDYAQKMLKKTYKAEKKLSTTAAEKKAAKKRYIQAINKTYNKRYSVLDRSIDKSRVGKRGVNRINDRMNRGDTYNVAFAKEEARQIAAGYAIGIAMLTAPYVKNMTISHLARYANEKNIQRANAGLARIGTMKYKKVAKNVYQQVMR